MRCILSGAAVAAAIILMTAAPARSTPWDDKAKLILHIRPATSGNACTNYGALGDCRDANTAAGLTLPLEGPFYFVYLLAVPGSTVAGISEVKCGIQYQEGAGGAIGDHVGIDILAWRPCATLQTPSTGAPVWPQPGSGNTINWDLPESCQETETGVTGYFYLGAYSADLLQIVTEPVSGDATVRSCASITKTLDAARDLGSAAFSPGAVEVGCNACDAPCDGSPVLITTWGRIKSIL